MLPLVRPLHGAPYMPSRSTCWKVCVLLYIERLMAAAFLFFCLSFWECMREAGGVPCHCCIDFADCAALCKASLTPHIYSLEYVASC